MTAADALWALAFGLLSVARLLIAHVRRSG